ncbi:MAG TPA: EamA family transporter RarD [Verrucomicrobium sp.]|nr:EamA family transporter RarD [Verrucomicrobium sp.]
MAVLSAVTAFFLWGVLPIYWKAAVPIGSAVIVAHRVWGTILFLVPLLKSRDEFDDWIAALKTPSLLRVHGWAALLLTANWSLFIWANQHGRIVEASVGYFLNPLLNVFIGFLFLGERLSRLQMVSVSLAGLGVLMQVIMVGHFPWIALLLASTFGVYGLVRRRSSLGSLTGLAVETVLVLPFALAWLTWCHFQGLPLWGSGTSLEIGLVIGAGVATALPLLTFAYAARQLRFSTLGLLQFIAPTGQFLLGALLYREPVTVGAMVSFAFIWAGVAVFCLNALGGGGSGK